MKSDWDEVRLGDCITDMASGPFGSSLTTACFVGSGCPVLEGSNLKGFKVADEFVKYVTREKALSLKRCLAHRNDVVVTIRGTLGQIAYVPEDSKHEAYLCCQSQFRVTFDGSLINVPYIVYWFHSREGQEKLLSFSAQVGVPALSQPLKNFPKISLRIPPLPVQRRIAAVLGALDDKIELNRKMNANLEAQAQALFKSWFVDFAPWGGKMPKEWKMGTLGELVTVCYGKDHKKLADGSIPVFGSGGLMRYAEKALFDQESVLIPRKGSLNNIMYAAKPFWTVDTMFYTKMRVRSAAKYVYLFLHGKDMSSLNTGSAVPSMTTDILNAMKIIIPSEKGLSEFDRKLSPLFRMIAANAAESRKLAETRDALLPKLMSGEVEAV